jgi:hypothetical protein
MSLNTDKKLFKIKEITKYQHTTTDYKNAQENAMLNPLNAELNLICYLPALLGARHLLHVSRIRVKSLTLRLLMSYIYMNDISSLRVKHQY